MAGTIRMKDIAEKVGVSTVSVSKALNGQRGVSEETRQKILDAAHEMGYDDNARAKTRSSRVSYSLGIIIPRRYMDDHNTFYAELQQNVTIEASKMQCFTMAEIVTEEMIQARQVPDMIKFGRVDGIIVIGRAPDDYLELLEHFDDIPRMYVDFSIPSPDTDCVISDSYYGAYQVTNYLFSKGHRDIAFIGTVLSTSSITDRYLGYCRSMMEHHVEIKKEWVIDDRFAETGQMDSEKLFRLPDPLPTAFFCNCDLAASYLTRKLQKMGIEVPKDVSVAGFDNFLTEDSSHRFTTYEVDLKEMARKAVHNMIHKLNREYYRRGTVIVTGKLIEGETVREIQTD